MNPPPKYMAFIAAAGRTGTTFFGERLSEMIDGAYSVSEPDVVEGFASLTFDQIRTFGWHHMVIGKLFGKTGIRNLARNFLAGNLTSEDTVEAIRRHRDRYYGSIDADYIIESYAQWFGLLPVLSEIYPNHKVVGLIRDPRTWVASVMNYGTQFGRRDWVTKLGFQRLNPRLLRDSEYADRWPGMSAFQKNCWHWKLIYTHIDRHVVDHSNARMFRYEDLFLAPDRIENVTEMLEFLTRFPGRQFRYDLKADILNTRSRASKTKTYPDWPEWTRSQARQLQDICGPLMQRFEYGSEPRWQELVG
jgi:hypothetical protein